MYLERLKKLREMKELIERALLQQGEFPDKAYVKQLLGGMDTRYAIFEFENVQPDTKFDLAKMVNDLRCIQKDLRIIYEIVDELAREKYNRLEAFVNGYLSSLEDIADKADKKAMEEMETSSLGASIIFFTNDVSDAQIDNTTATIRITNLRCTPQSKLYGSIIGTGFNIEDVVFQIGERRFSPYSVNNSTFKVGGSLERNTYTYAINEDYPVGSAFKIPNSSIEASERNQYEAYGARDKVKETSNTHSALVAVTELQGVTTTETTTYSFYIGDATKITFDFSIEPTYKNFSSYENQNLDRNRIYRFEFTVPAGTAFSWIHDGTIFATKEKVSVNGSELCIVENTMAKDFIIYEYAPGDKVVYDDVKVVIHNIRQEVFRIESVAIKEISETGVAAPV